MNRYALSHDAELDVFEALNSRERRSERAALALERQFIDAFIYLSEWPGTGHIREELPGMQCAFGESTITLSPTTQRQFRCKSMRSFMDREI